MAKVIGKIQRIPKRGPKGLQGLSGMAGRDGTSPKIEDILRLIQVPSNGIDGTSGKDGQDGLRGPQGAQGTKGDSLSLEQVKPLVEALVKSEVEKVELPEPIKETVREQHFGGGRNPVKYITTITEATYSILKAQLGAGMNIFGVNYAGDVTITLPTGHQQVKDQVIIINDESGAAGTNNITIKTNV